RTRGAHARAPAHRLDRGVRRNSHSLGAITSDGSNRRRVHVLLYPHDRDRIGPATEITAPAAHQRRRRAEHPLVPLASRQKRRDPSRGLPLFAQRKSRDHDGHPDKRARDAPEKGPEEHREQDQERREREGSPGDAWLEVAADEELDDVEPHEYDDGQLPRAKLQEREKGGKYRRHQRADERDIG